MEPSQRGRHRRPPRPAAAMLASAAAVALLGWTAILPAHAETVEFTIADTRIAESSGLATDTGNERYWTVNDSGDSGIAYALDAEGETEGTLEFRVDPVDVEAVAFRDGRLYVADIGDNRERRDAVTVYFFDDAEPADQPDVYKAYDFAYPDGPHDAETLLVDGDGRLFIVTKGDSGAIYAAPTAPSRQGVNELERVGDAPAYVTDGTVLSDGRFVLRTYVSVEVVDPDSYEVVARAATPTQRQGESVTTTFDGGSLLIGSEGKRSEVLRIDIPTSLGEVPSASASPPPTSAAPTSPGSPTDTPSGSPTAAPADDLPNGTDAAGPRTNRVGTIIALGLAAAIAVAAGVVVVLFRRT